MDRPELHFCAANKANVAYANQTGGGFVSSVPSNGMPHQHTRLQHSHHVIADNTATIPCTTAAGTKQPSRAGSLEIENLVKVIFSFNFFKPVTVETSLKEEN